MINITNTSVSFGVETKQMLNPAANLGRLSLRLVTLQSWTHGLFILDLAHMPSNTCGVWPALWMLGSGLWPLNGEIDIIEYVNNGANNLMALHSSPNCTVAGANELGTLLTSDCGAGAGFTGCTVSATQPNNAGDDFNANGGGVYAWEWTSTSIRIWFFPREAIPESIVSGEPDVDSFGTPTANFEGGCDFDAHFYNATILFNVDFCGSYAGNVWQANGCPMLDPENGWSSCNTYVALNPTAFEQTFWEVNYLKVYQAPSGVSTSTSALSSVTPAISTSSGVSTALSGALGRTTSPTMSLAGATPTIPPGTFTRTSSVLSVLSSLLSESAATVSSSSLPTSPGLPFTPASTPPSLVTPIPTTLSSMTSSIPAPPPTSTSSGSAIPCTGTVCTSNVYVTVVSTITVVDPTPRALVTTVIHPRHDAETNNWSQFDRCGFEIFPATASKDRWTEYACTLTRLEVLNGDLITETLTASTPVQSGTPLKFGEVLVIDRIVMETRKKDHLDGIKEYASTGSFTPSGTSFSLTTLTAYPESVSHKQHTPPTSISAVDSTPCFSLINRQASSEVPVVATPTLTSYSTVSIDFTISKPASTMPTAPPVYSGNSACSFDRQRMPVILSIILAIAFTI